MLNYLSAKYNNSLERILDIGPMYIKDDLYMVCIDKYRLYTIDLHNKPYIYKTHCTLPYPVNYDVLNSIFNNDNYSCGSISKIIRTKNVLYIHFYSTASYPALNILFTDNGKYLFTIDNPEFSIKKEIYNSDSILSITTNISDIEDFVTEYNNKTQNFENRILISSQKNNHNTKTYILIEEDFDAIIIDMIDMLDNIGIVHSIEDKLIIK